MKLSYSIMKQEIEYNHYGIMSAGDNEEIYSGNDISVVISMYKILKCSHTNTNDIVNDSDIEINKKYVRYDLVEVKKYNVLIEHTSLATFYVLKN